MLNLGNTIVQLLHCLSLSSCQFKSALTPAALLLLLESKLGTWSGIICDFWRSLREFLDPIVNRFMQQTLPTINKKYFFMNILCIVSFFPQKNAQESTALQEYILQAWSPIWLLKPASEHAHACLLPRLPWSWLYCYLVIHIANL
jgi:hypothetical protein